MEVAPNFVESGQKLAGRRRDMAQARDSSRRQWLRTPLGPTRAPASGPRVGTPLRLPRRARPPPCSSSTASARRAPAAPLPRREPRAGCGGGADLRPNAALRCSMSLPGRGERSPSGAPTEPLEAPRAAHERLRPRNALCCALAASGDGGGAKMIAAQPAATRNAQRCAIDVLGRWPCRFQEGWPKFARRRPTFPESGPISAEGGPSAVKSRPSSSSVRNRHYCGRFRPTLRPARPTSTIFGPESTNIGPTWNKSESAQVDYMFPNRSNSA